MSGRVHRAGRHGRLFHELLDRGGVRDDLVGERGDGAVELRSESDALHGGGAVAHDGGQLASWQGEFDGAPGVARGHGGEHGLWARGALGAEAAADVLGDDRDLIGPEPEHGGQGVADRSGAWQVVHGQLPVVRPVGGGGVRFHGVVVQGPDCVRDVDLYRGHGEGAVEVAAFADGRVSAVHRLRCVQARVVLGEPDIVSDALVLDPDGLGSCPRRLERVGHHERHLPAPVRDPVVLEDCQDRVVGLSQFRGVLMGEDGVHAGQGERLAGMDRRDPAAYDGGGYGPGVQTAGRRVLGGVAGGAGDLVPALAADHGAAQRLGDLAHGGRPHVLRRRR